MVEPSLLAKLPMICFAALLVWAAVTDVATYTIPNRLNLAMAALWPAHLVARPESFDPSSLVSFALVLVVGFGLFAWGKLGGGDVKLTAVTSLWLGGADVPSFLIVTALVGGAMALLVVGPFRPFMIAAGGLAVLAPRLLG